MNQQQWIIIVGQGVAATWTRPAITWKFIATSPKIVVSQ
jgi:hypothetical protein